MSIRSSRTQRQHKEASCSSVFDPVKDQGRGIRIIRSELLEARVAPHTTTRTISPKTAGGQLRTAGGY